MRKDTHKDLLFKSIRTLMAGEYWVGHAEIHDLIKNLQTLSSLLEQKTKLQA